MEALYILSTIILLTTFVLRKKTEKDIDIIGFICTSIVLLFCYNTLVCYILTFFTIPITLCLLAIINLIFSIVLVIPIIKKKEIQKYKFNKIDILYVCLIIIALLIIAYINFGFPLDVNYMSSDPSLHFLTSLKFAESDALLPGIEEQDPVYGFQDTRKTVSYVNSGLLMKCFCKDIDTLECYNIFACFSILTFVLIGVTLYCALNKFAKNKEHTFWAFLVALICSLGYPLNSFVFGFEYLTMGLLIICAIIDMIYYYDNQILSLPYLVLIFGLLNFGLFSSYYMFVPFVYPALWVYFCIKGYQKNKKVFNKEAIVLCGITLLLPFFLGYIYHIEPKMYSIIIDQVSNSVSVDDYSSHLVNTGLAVDGFIYINLYSNMLLLLPLTIYLFIIDVKENKLDKELFLTLISMLVILFIGFLLIGNKFGKVSIYYLSKNYFALWIILAFTNYKGLVLLSEKSKYLSRLFIYAYIFLIIIYTIFAKVKVDGSNKNEDENLLSLVEIYGANKTLLFYKIHEFEQEELEILEYANKNLDFNTRIEVIADHRSYYWSYVLLRYTDRDQLFNSKLYGRSNIAREKIY